MVNVAISGLKMPSKWNLLFMWLYFDPSNKSKPNDKDRYSNANNLGFFIFL